MYEGARFHGVDLQHVLDVKLGDTDLELACCPGFAILARAECKADVLSTTASCK
jgi:hypothetical protein